MFRTLLPREVGFFDFFEQHAGLIIKACEAFLELTHAEIADHDALAARIKEIENQADTVTHQCMEALNKTFVTPIDRGDIHALIKRMDDVVDSIDATAARISMYGVEEIREEAKKSAELLLNAGHDIEAVIQGLRHLKHTEQLQQKLIAIHQWENDGDAILRAALTRLFREEKDAILVIKWKEIFERLEKATDRCEEIAHIIEGILIELS